MVFKFKSIALAAAMVVIAAPAFAQDINLNPLGLDLDPFHIFAPAPAAAPAMEKAMMKKKMMMSKKMMSKKMMKKKMMMKK